MIRRVLQVVCLLGSFFARCYFCAQVSAGGHCGVAAQVVPQAYGLTYSQVLPTYGTFNVLGAQLRNDAAQQYMAQLQQQQLQQQQAANEWQQFQQWKAAKLQQQAAAGQWQQPQQQAQTGPPPGPQPEQVQTPTPAPPQIDDPNRPWANQYPTLIARCSACHKSADAPHFTLPDGTDGGPLAIDGSTDLRHPEAWRKRDAIMGALADGTMPKKGQLAPDDPPNIWTELYGARLAGLNQPE